MALEYSPRNGTALEYDATGIKIYPPVSATFVNCTSIPCIEASIDGGKNYTCLPPSSIVTEEESVTLEVLPSYANEERDNTLPVSLKIPSNSFCLSNITSLPSSPVTYHTSIPLPPSPSINNANSTETPAQIPVYGIGVYVTDISSISLKTSNFYADLRIYILKYYRPYTEETKSDVLASALDPSDPKKCNYMDGEKWIYLTNTTFADIASQKLITGVNMDPNPRITPILQPDDCTSNSCPSTASESGTLDHIRVQSQFSFPPELSTFPFSTQTLPLAFEFPFSTSSTSDYSVCDLSRYTGFSPTLTSYSPDNKIPDFSYYSAISNGLYPPFPGSHPHVYDPKASPIHATPRYTLSIVVPTPLTFSVLTLLPSFIILVTSLLIYVILPQKNYHLKIQALTTSLLAAVYQQGSVSGGTVVSLADWFCLIVYIGVTACIIGSGIDGWYRRNQEDDNKKPLDEARAKRAHRYFRVIPLSSPVLFLALVGGKHHVKVGFATLVFVWAATIAFIWMYIRRSEDELPPDALPSDSQHDNSYRTETPTLLSFFLSPGSRQRRTSRRPFDRSTTGSSAYFDEKNYADWGEQEFGKWLESKGIDACTLQVLKEEGLDGRCMQGLTISDLRSFGLNYKTAKVVNDLILGVVGNHKSRGFDDVSVETNPARQPAPILENSDVMYSKAEKIMKEKFGDSIMLPKPNLPGTELEMTEISHPPAKKSFTELRADMYADPPPIPASYVPSLPAGLDPSSMPPEIQDILRRRPDLVSQALQQSKVNATREQEEGDRTAFQQPDLLSPPPQPDNLTVPTPHTPPKVSKIQANMLTSQRGYAERFAGMAAAAELQGIKIASSRNKKRYEDDDHQNEDESDDVGLLSSKQL